TARKSRALTPGESSARTPSIPSPQGVRKGEGVLIDASLTRGRPGRHDVARLSVGSPPFWGWVSRFLARRRRHGYQRAPGRPVPCVHGVRDGSGRCRDPRRERERRPGGGLLSAPAGPHSVGHPPWCPPPPLRLPDAAPGVTARPPGLSAPAREGSSGCGGGVVPAAPPPPAPPPAAPPPGSPTPPVSMQDAAQEITLGSLGLSAQTVEGSSGSVAVLMPAPAAPPAAIGNFVRIFFAHSSLLDPAGSSVT